MSKKHTFLESKFEQYLDSNARDNWHPEIGTFNDENKHIIVYGPRGSGKYTQALKIINNITQNSLKHERKMIVSYDKQNYTVKMSDVHYEIDMSLLGCNAKSLWYAIYTQIVDSSKTARLTQKPLELRNVTPFVLCTEFQDIHVELLDDFYSYMQKQMCSDVMLRFVLVTSELCFLPNNILNCSTVVSVKVPNSTAPVDNLKQLPTKTTELTKPHKMIGDRIVLELKGKGKKQINLIDLRNILYEMLICNVDVAECVWYVVGELHKQRLSFDDAPKAHGKMTSLCAGEPAPQRLCNYVKALNSTYSFFKYYNNKYRPIYHLENYFLGLVCPTA